MKERFEYIAHELSEIGSEARLEFGGFSPSQLEWKPSAESWSVAQCLDHLIVSQSAYFPLLRRLADGSHTPSLWERISPLSGFFGRFMLRSLRPEASKKFKAPGKARPSASAIGEGIVERFADHQAELAAHVERLPTGLDGATIISSPLLPLVTYSLDHCLEILAVHGRRHVEQARRVTRADGFPP